jgi:L-rhamnonate dehydratase
MKIVEIRAVQPPTPGSPADWRTQLGQIVVEVVTDQGVNGIGVGGGGVAGVHVVHTVLRDLLLGRDPSDVEHLHAEMLSHTDFYGRKGIVVMAISGVDLALWDIRGKVAKKNVAELLAPEGDVFRPLDTYATVFGDEEIETALNAGNSALKLHVERFGDRPDPSSIASLVHSIRTKVGPEMPIMVDAFARWDVDSTLQVAEAIAPFDITWLEEPLPPSDFKGYAELVKHSPIPIAGGEHEYTAAGFRELLDSELHAVLQPDINWCGGLTTLVDVYRMAQARGVRVCPHRGSEAFALPAIAALDLQPLAESPRSWFRCLTGAPTIKQGKTQVTRAAGFGVDVDVETRQLLDAASR